MLNQEHPSKIIKRLPIRRKPRKRTKKGSSMNLVEGLEWRSAYVTMPIVTLDLQHRHSTVLLGPSAGSPRIQIQSFRPTHVLHRIPSLLRTRKPVLFASISIQSPGHRLTQDNSVSLSLLLWGHEICLAQASLSKPQLLRVSIDKKKKRNGKDLVCDK